MLVINTLHAPSRFLNLQRAFYRGDDYYVPPLAHVDCWQISPGKNPFFETAETEFFVAKRKGRVVGRISATRNSIHDKFYDTRVGFFGHFEATDESAAHALLDRTAQWLRKRRATRLQGPVDLSTNYRCGLLLAGQPGLPVIGMPHNPPSYPSFLESYGLQKAKDLLSIRVRADTINMNRVERLALKIRNEGRLRLRPIDFSCFEKEIETLWMLYNRIWERNWGFVPMHHGEFKRWVSALKSLHRPELVQIAEAEQGPAGFIISLPNISPAIQACNGRLWPFGWRRFRRVLGQERLIRVLTLGALKEFRAAGVATLLLHSVVSEGLALGFNECEASWILEDNTLMLRSLERMGGTVNRRHRIYEKEL